VQLRSNHQGIYVSPPLRAGEYTVTVTAKGFESAAKRLQLDVSQRATVDFDLTLGTLTQEVAVVDATPVLQTETSTLFNLRTEKAIKDLRLNGSNFAQLLQLSAGVMPAQTQTMGSPITMKRGVTGNSVNGTRLEENNYLVDGISNTENHNGLGILIFPSVDAIAEFRVESSVSDAQFGRGGGGTVNLIYVRIERLPWQLVRVFPQFRTRCQELLRPARRSDPAVPAEPVRRHARRSAAAVGEREGYVFLLQLRRHKGQAGANSDQLRSRQKRSAMAISQRRRSASSIRSHSGKRVRISSPRTPSPITAFLRTGSILSDATC
jgi:hypothetical protein